MDIAAERAYPTPFANSSLFTTLVLSLARDRNSPKTSNDFCEEYDYIVVGAGSAGSVLANRLSEDPRVSVLLLEAGIRAPILNDVPSVPGSFYGPGSEINWAYKTEPQLNTGAALINRELAWASGKALGGSSVLNTMLNVRGNRQNYDDWAKGGAEGWSYDDCLPYFKKLEDFQVQQFVNNGYHGIGGPVTIRQPNYTAEIKTPIIEAARELGYEFVDHNGPRQTGFVDPQTSIRNGQRCSTAKAYLVPAENRTNLNILTKARVRKVLIENNRAYGVQFDFQGRTCEVHARREVIVSAGAVNSAQLLMLSGIGPRKELEKFNIKVIADLPVGLNFQDHLSAFVPYAIDDGITPYTSKLKDDENIRRYIDYRSGPLATPFGLAIMAFLGKHSFDPDVDRPDHELFFIEGDVGLMHYARMKPEIIQKVYGPYENSTFYLCMTGQLHPRSRGVVRLRSADPYDPPSIDPKYFDDPADIDDIVQGMLTCNKIANTYSMKSIGTKPFETIFPGCEDYVEDDYLYLECQAKSLVLSLSHPMGTAKMGNPADPSTVVDPQLRVKGIRGLRVVDASIMPKAIWGHFNIPTIMIAEKASDIIKREIRCEFGDAV